MGSNFMIQIRPSSGAVIVLNTIFAFFFPNYDYNFLVLNRVYARVSQKVNGLKKHIYCKYTETKLISLFNVIPLDFNAGSSISHVFFNLHQKKSFFLVASLTNFAPRQ
jgi:hypothetical protein